MFAHITQATKIQQARKQAINHAVYIFALETGNISRQQDYGTADIHYFNKDTLQVRVCNICKMVITKNPAGGDGEGDKK